MKWGKMGWGRGRERAQGKMRLERQRGVVGIKEEKGGKGGGMWRERLC